MTLMKTADNTYILVLDKIDALTYGNPEVWLIVEAMKLNYRFWGFTVSEIHNAVNTLIEQGFLDSDGKGDLQRIKLSDKYVKTCLPLNLAGRIDYFKTKDDLDVLVLNDIIGEEFLGVLLDYKARGVDQSVDYKAWADNKERDYKEVLKAIRVLKGEGYVTLYKGFVKLRPEISRNIDKFNQTTMDILKDNGLSFDYLVYDYFNKGAE